MAWNSDLRRQVARSFLEVAERTAKVEADCGCWKGREPRCARCENPAMCLLCGQAIAVGDKYHVWNDDAMHLQCIIERVGP